MSYLGKRKTESTPQNEAQHKRGRLPTMASPPNTANVHQSKRLPVSLQHEPSSSPLLKLPGELRNRIYQFALTTSRGIYLDPDNPTRFLDAAFDYKIPYEDRKTVNLLKFTCRQLYKETAGIEIQFNRVEFFGCPQPSDRRFCYSKRPYNWSPGPARAFNDFISNCTATKAKWFREITCALCCDLSICLGSDSVVKSETELLAVDEFCRDHPHVNVRYNPEYLDASARTPEYFILANVYLSLQFRGKDLRQSIQRPGALLSGQNSIWSRFEWPVEKNTNFILSAPNFRFWPKPGALDRVAFRNDLVKWDLWLEFEADVCLELATDWIKNGL